jgi:hypothetical protein
MGFDDNGVLQISTIGASPLNTGADFPVTLSWQVCARLSAVLDVVSPGTIGELSTTDKDLSEGGAEF